MKKDVMIVTGAGQIGMAIARRTGFGKKIILGDRSLKNAEAISKIMNEAGYDVEAFQMDLSDRESILSLIGKALEYGPVKNLVNAAGVSPSQAPVETILKVDLYGTAVLLEEVGKVIAEGGSGVTISSQSGWRMPQLTPEEGDSLPRLPQRSFSHWNFFSLRTSGIPCTHISWPSAATKKGSCTSASGGEREEQDSMILPRALSLRLLPSMNSTVPEEISIKICSQSALQDGPARQTKWQISQNF